jgi:hypothetical protein
LGNESIASRIESRGLRLAISKFKSEIRNPNSEVRTKTLNLKCDI